MGLGFHNRRKEPNLPVGFAVDQERDWWSVFCGLPVQIKPCMMTWKGKQCYINPTKALKTSKGIELSALKNQSSTRHDGPEEDLG